MDEMIKNLFILLMIVIVFGMIYNPINVNERWMNYVLKPYNYMLTGRDPPYYYRRDLYKKPYRYPYQFFKSYPFPHLSYCE